MARVREHTPVSKIVYRSLESATRRGGRMRREWQVLAVVPIATKEVSDPDHSLRWFLRRTTRVGASAVTCTLRVKPIPDSFERSHERFGLMPSPHAKERSR